MGMAQFRARDFLGVAGHNSEAFFLFVIHSVI